MRTDLPIADAPTVAAADSPPLSRNQWIRAVEALALSPQQARIVSLILQGKRDKQIAAAMGVRIATVRTHLGRLFARIGVADRVELLLMVFAIVMEYSDVP